MSQFDRKQLFKSLYLIRRTEERLAEIYPTDKIKSPTHLSIGQESVSVGVCSQLSRDDAVFGTYRGHALYLAKGGDLKKMIAELYGKDEGCARGKGGSMHLVDTDVGMMGTSAIVGTTIANAVGYAFAIKAKNEKRVAVSFFGDGATEEGVFYESVNFAALHKLPIIFVCENNRNAVYTPLAKRQAIEKMHEKVKPFGIATHFVNDADVLNIAEKITEWKNAIMNEKAEGPFFIESMTYRWREHVGPNEDFNLGHRERSEMLPWVENDQVKILYQELGTEGDLIKSQVDKEIEEAIDFAEAAPVPAKEELFTHVYKD